MTAVDEEVQVSDADLENGPACGGHLYGPIDDLRRDDCDYPAAWRMTATCCKTRTIFKCEYHHDIHVYLGLGCRYCDSYPIELTWRRL